MSSAQAFLSRSLFADMTRSAAAPLIAAFDYPWEILGDLSEFILELGKSLSESDFRKINDGVWVHKSASVAPSASLTGPLIISEGAQVRHCAFVRGSAIVGREAVVGNSTEIKNSVLFDGVQVPHFNYVGDSILGYRAHLGAGAITSNVRLDRAEISAHLCPGVTSNSESAPSVRDVRINTHRKKCGAMIGDLVEIACNTALNPGSVIPRASHVLPRRWGF